MVLWAAGAIGKKEAGERGAVCIIGNVLSDRPHFRLPRQRPKAAGNASGAVSYGAQLDSAQCGASSSETGLKQSWWLVVIGDQHEDNRQMRMVAGLSSFGFLRLASGSLLSKARSTVSAKGRSQHDLHLLLLVRRRVSWDTKSSLTILWAIFPICLDKCLAKSEIYSPGYRGLF